MREMASGSNLTNNREQIHLTDYITHMQPNADEWQQDFACVAQTACPTGSVCLWAFSFLRSDLYFQRRTWVQHSPPNATLVPFCFGSLSVSLNVGLLHCHVCSGLQRCCRGQGWSQCLTPCPPPAGVWAVQRAECRASSPRLLKNNKEQTLRWARSASKHLKDRHKQNDGHWSQYVTSVVEPCAPSRGHDGYRSRRHGALNAVWRHGGHYKLTP